MNSLDDNVACRSLNGFNNSLDSTDFCTVESSYELLWTSFFRIPILLHCYYTTISAESSSEAKVTNNRSIERNRSSNKSSISRQSLSTIAPTVNSTASYSPVTNDTLLTHDTGRSNSTESTRPAVIPDTRLLSVGEQLLKLTMNADTTMGASSVGIYSVTAYFSIYS